MDFTINTYRLLLQALCKAGYHAITFEQYCSGEQILEPFVILRHDVDKRPSYSVRFAQIEHAMNIHASYYFRCVPCSNVPDDIHTIVALGHEIGYHYEDMTLYHGDVDMAKQHFDDTLAYFRSYYPVRTICMHGSPTSRYDGRDLWKRYDYHDNGLIGEPYFDMDFSRALYLTDTGRCWDGYKVSVRDKVKEQEEWSRKGLTFHRTNQIIDYLQHVACGNKPVNMMITTHPQRWTADWLHWLEEWMLQMLKNGVKRLLIYGKTHTK